jgi:electron transport complex protein RnfC
VNPDPCIRCGWCVEACPSSIHPAGLLDASQRRDHAAADRYGISACVECGLCDYVCPSRLPILNGIRMMRKEA